MIIRQHNYQDLQAINYGIQPENQAPKKFKENIFVGKKNVVYSFGRCSFPPTCCLGDTCNAKSGEKPTNIVSWRGTCLCGLYETNQVMSRLFSITEPVTEAELT